MLKDVIPDIMRQDTIKIRDAPEFDGLLRGVLKSTPESLLEW